MFDMYILDFNDLCVIDCVKYGWSYDFFVFFESHQRLYESSGGNLVDGLPPASSIYDMLYLCRIVIATHAHAFSTWSNSLVFNTFFLHCFVVWLHSRCRHFFKHYAYGKTYV